MSSGNKSRSRYPNNRLHFAGFLAGAVLTSVVGAANAPSTEHIAQLLAELLLDYCGASRSDSYAAEMVAATVMAVGVELGPAKGVVVNSRHGP